MHEFSIAEALASRVLEYAPAGAIVRDVEIVVGAMRGLEPEALQMSWEAVIHGTGMAGCTLSVDQRPWTITCSNCGRSWTGPKPELCQASRSDCRAAAATVPAIRAVSGSA